MAARRCTPCDLDYPSDQHKCPACGLPTWALGDKDGYDKEWRKKADSRRALYVRKPIDPLPSLDISLAHYRGNMFVVADLLTEHGFDPHEGLVITVNGRFYELNGYVHPATGHDYAGWWIEEIVPEDALAELFQTHGVREEEAQEA